MKEVVMYRYGSFNDYKGQEHKVIVCAVSTVVNTNNSKLVSPVLVFDNEEDIFGTDFTVEKILTFGVAICNPVDTYNEEYGNMIAYNKAKHKNAPILTSSRLGFFNTDTVTALTENYIKYIIKDPGSVIRGYDTAKKKFLKECDLKDDVAKMDEVMKSKLKVLAESTPESVAYAKEIVKYLE